MHANLSFDQAPPISAPFRFFLTAPWFGALAGVVLTVTGADALGSRWTPVALALTHLMVVGFMLQAMCGAVLQFVPVAAGANIWRPLWVARAIHPLLALAALALAGGLLWQSPDWLSAAMVLFTLAIGVFVGVTTWGLWRTPAGGATLWALRIAVLALAVTVVLGVWLAEILARGGSAPLLEIAAVHLSWGLGGWAGVLLAGVSYAVVPMFQLTRPYPRWLAQGFAPATMALLTLTAWQRLSGATWGLDAATGGLLALAAAYAGVTLRLQYTRRRKTIDTTFRLFRVGMVSLLACVVLTGLQTFLPTTFADPRYAVATGVLAIAGTFVSVINGMMYKIMPFLNWLHLQRLGASLAEIPNMKNMISERAMLWQYRLHLLAVGLLLLALVAPPLTRAAGLCLTASFVWLAWNLTSAARRYRQFKMQIHPKIQPFTARTRASGADS